MSKARDLASKGVITDRSQVLSNKSFSDQITAPSANILTLNSVGMVEWNSANDTYTQDGRNVTNTHRGMRRCVMNSAGEVVYYLDQDNSNLRANGSPAILTGAHGDVMVEIPRFYYRFTDLGDNIRWEISDQPLPGFTIHPAFMFRGVEVPFRYIGAYDASVFAVASSTYIDGLNLDDNTSRVNRTAVTGDKLASVSGRFPMVGLTRAEFRTLARNRGDGTSSSVFQQLDFYLVSAIQLLMLVEYGTFNIQARIGTRNSQVAAGYPASSSNQADFPHSVAGRSNHIGNNTGGLSSAVRDTEWMSYRGIENFYGNCWNFVDGYNSINLVPWINNNPATWADDTTSNYTQLGVAVPLATPWAYVRNIQKLGGVFLPSSVSGGSASTFITDILFSSTGNTVSLVGGNAANGLFNGPFCWNVNRGSSLRVRDVGSRIVR